MSTTTLASLLSDSISSRLADLRVCLPGSIESYDAATQTCSVKPDGDFPVISGVPVQFASGGAYSITFPVAKGDGCLLIFADQSIDDWYAGTGLPQDPRAHALTDAICLVGLRPKASQLPECDASRASFGNHGPRVACDGSVVHVGVAHNESGTQEVVRGTDHLQALSQYIDNLLTIILSLLNTGANSGGPVVFAGLATVLADIANAKATYESTQHLSNKVKVP